MGLIGDTKIISLINLKGGVGKTTSAVNIAATLADRENKENLKKKGQKNRVLLIDLDLQSNASLTLLNRYSKNTQEEAKNSDSSLPLVTHSKSVLEKLININHKLTNDNSIKR